MNAKKKPESDPTKHPGGRPEIEFTPEQIDDAKRAIGRRLYLSIVVAELAKRHKIGRDSARRLIDAARQDVIDSFQASGTASDPLTAWHLALVAIVADPKASNRDKIAAIALGIKLLGLDRLAAKLGDLSPEDFIAGVMSRRAARLAEPSAN